MKLKLNAAVAVVLFAVGVVGCGGAEAPCEACPVEGQREEVGEVQQVQDTACRVDQDCTPEDPEDPPPPPVTATIGLEVENGTPYARRCTLTFDYGAPTQQSVYDSDVPAYAFRAGTSQRSAIGPLYAHARAACARTDAPEQVVSYSASLYADKPMVCRFIYFEPAGGIPYFYTSCRY